MWGSPEAKRRSGSEARADLSTWIQSAALPSRNPRATELSEHIDSYEGPSGDSAVARTFVLPMIVLTIGAIAKITRWVFGG